MLFVFLFLTVNLLSQILPRSARTKNIAMLVCSLFFYLWAGPKYLLLLLGMTMICWVGAIKLQTTQVQKQRQYWLLGAIAGCLLLLSIFRYADLFLGTTHRLFGVPDVVPTVVAPLGIAFYTLRLISYLVDVYRVKVEAESRFWMLLLFASLFHLSIAGPIVRYRDIQKDLSSRQFNIQDISSGISRVTIGLAKLTILASGCATIADQLLFTTKPELAAVPALGIALGALVFSLEVYLDLSGCADMAIGMGLLCGLHYQENFQYPYLAGSITEFWQRWNISLSSFFQDYIFRPITKSSEDPIQKGLALFVTWFLLGLWHGASWNFVLWGLFFGVWIGLEQLVLGEQLNVIPSAVKHIAVLLLVMFGFLIYRFTDLGLLGTALSGLFGLNENGFMDAAVGEIFRNNLFFLIFSVIAVTPLGHLLRLILGNLSFRGKAFTWVNAIWETLHPLILLILSAMALVGGSFQVVL